VCHVEQPPVERGWAVGIRFLMARVRMSVRTTMQRLGVEDRLGAANSI
jgi:hypothetical protein